MKKLLALMIGMAATTGAYAQSLEHFEGDYRLISAKSGENWQDVECPTSSLRVKLAMEHEAPAINFYSINNEGERWLDPDLYSFRGIGSKKSGGGTWDGSSRVTGSYQCGVLEDGTLKRVQKMSTYLLGIAPTGSSSTVVSLEEKNGRLTYRRMIDEDLVIECKYKKSNP